MNQDSRWCWCICVGGFINLFLAAAYFNCGGVVLSALVDHYHLPRSEAASITSLPASCVYLFAPLSTFICSRYGVRTNIFLGSVVSTFAAISSSFVNDAKLLYFTYGVCGGLGSSLLFFPNFIVLPKYFKSKISIANGLVLSGGPIGTFILSPVIQQMLSGFGLNNGFRVLGSFYVTLFISFMLFRPLKTHGEGNDMEERKWLSTHVFRNFNYMALLVVVFLYQLQHMVPYTHLVRFAEDVGTNKFTASFLISIIAGTSLVGRLICGCIADLACVNRLHTLQIALLCTAVSTVLVQLAHSYVWVALYAAVFGFSEGIYVILFIVIIRDIVETKHLSFALGVAYGILAIPKTLGALLAGFLFDLTKSYTLSFMVASAFVALSSLLMSAIDIPRKLTSITISKALPRYTEDVVFKETTV